MTWSESVARSLQKHSPDGGGSLLAISSGGFDRAHAWLTAPPGPVCRECPMAGTCRAASSGSEPAAPASVLEASDQRVRFECRAARFPATVAIRCLRAATAWPNGYVCRPNRQRNRFLP